MEANSGTTDTEPGADFSFMVSQRGRRLVVKDDYKFCRNGLTKNGVRYSCTKKLCRAYLFMDCDEKRIVETQGTHDHPPHASLPPGNATKALLGLNPPKVYQEKPPKASVVVEKKTLPKRKVIPPKRISYPVPEEQETKPKVKKIEPLDRGQSQEDELKIQTLTAIDEACKDLSSDNSLFGKFTVTDEAKELMTEFIWKKMENYAEDVEAFANHANRFVVTEDDVKLLFRRNEALLERFEDLEMEIKQEDEMLQEEFYNAY